METLLDAMCGSSSSTDSSTSDQIGASGGSALAGGGGNHAVVQLSALLYGTFLKLAVLAIGRSHRAASGGAVGLRWQHQGLLLAWYTALGADSTATRVQCHGWYSWLASNAIGN
jgi:hypothetical protein